MATAVIEHGDGPQIINLITEVKKKAGALAPQKTSGVPFPFRGIDGTLNHLAPHIEEAGIVIAPRVISHTVTPREQGNRVVKTTEVEVEYTFYAPDGSNIKVVTAGLADDFADRSTAQAQSVAFRIALLQTFALPTMAPEPEVTGQAVQSAVPNSPLEKARNQGPKTPAKAPAKKGTTENVKALVRAAIDDPDNPLTSDQANKTWDEIAKRLGQEKGHPETLAMLKVELGL